MLIAAASRNRLAAQSATHKRLHRLWQTVISNAI
jgi:hypothetical protein